MNEQVIVTNTKKYKELLTREGVVAKKLPEGISASSGGMETRAHASWVCDQVLHFIETSHTEAAIMWYGFLQAMMWFEDERTLEELRLDNLGIM